MLTVVEALQIKEGQAFLPNPYACEFKSLYNLKLARLPIPPHPLACSNGFQRFDKSEIVGIEVQLPAVSVAKWGGSHA